MRQLLTGLILSCGLAGPIGAQPLVDAPAPKPAAQPAKAVDEIESGPKLELERVTHEFGAMDDTVPQSTTFKFTNTGNRTLVMEQPKSSCGCTAGALTQLEYLPGESGEISVTFNPEGRHGEQHKTVTLNSNDPNNPRQTIDIHGYVRQVVAFSPIGRTTFGNIALGETPSKIVTVTGQNTGFQITDIRVDKPETFEVKIVDERETEITDPYSKEQVSVRQFDMEVKVLPGAPVGRSLARVNVFTNDDRREMAIYPLTVTVQGDLRAIPARSVIGVVQPGAAFERTIEIQSSRGSKFEVFEAILLSNLPEGAAEVIATPVEDEDKGFRYQISVQGTAPDETLRVSGNIVLTTDAPGQTVMRIPFSGVVRPVITRDQLRNQPIRIKNLDDD